MVEEGEAEDLTSGLDPLSDASLTQGDAPVPVGGRTECQSGDRSDFLSKNASPLALQRVERSTLLADGRAGLPGSAAIDALPDVPAEGAPAQGAGDAPGAQGTSIDIPRSTRRKAMVASTVTASAGGGENAGGLGAAAYTAVMPGSVAGSQAGGRVSPLSGDTGLAGGASTSMAGDGNGQATGTIEGGTLASGSSLPEGRVSAALFSQTLEMTAVRPTALQYDGMDAASAERTVVLREGRFGADVGVAIARTLEGETGGLLIRLDPREMGRIHVHMGFDADGTLRAVLSADQPAALDLLQRESTHLARALNEAGVRADGQSLRFDMGHSNGGHSSSGGWGGGGWGGGGWDGSGSGGAGQQRSLARHGVGTDLASSQQDIAAPVLRSLRGSGHVDLMA